MSYLRMGRTRYPRFLVVDHKMDWAIDEGVIFAHYGPQLQAYGEAFLGLGHDIVGMG